MSELLDRAVQKARKLPNAEQNVIATIILEELEDEARWEQAFSRSQDALAKLAAEAMEEEIEKQLTVNRERLAMNSEQFTTHNSQPITRNLLLKGGDKKAKLN